MAPLAEGPENFLLFCLLDTLWETSDKAKSHMSIGVNGEEESKRSSTVYKLNLNEEINEEIEEAFALRKGV